ncbi:MAG: bifunctional [glutamate--ammonia ligase]-adenylyl-L-tyrosine phosphorylase/[glutamate--ammonia-ligase] adenylyltransferase, partial [Alphaproteobacteria bacterium]
SPGGDALERFDRIHAGHTSRVQRDFDDLFRSRRARADAMDGSSARDLLDSLDAPDVEARVAALGFREPAAAVAALRSIRDGVPESRAATRRSVQELAPALLAAVSDSPNPDRALSTFADFLGRVCARRTFTALLAENPATMRLLVSLFASSEYLSRVLLQHPELIDTLVRSDLAVTMKSGEEMGAELDAQLVDCGDLEERLDVLRRFRNDEMLRIGVHDILGEMHYNVVADQLSALADTCLGRAYRIALEERIARHGAPPGLGLAVIAMGKLGSLELNYHSDLDLIFVYGPTSEPPPDVPGAPAPDGLSAHEFFSKVAQLLMMVLQLATREGWVYKIDTRLRPSGRGGPLVTSLEAFDAYHAESAALWERQALVRARVVCGPSDLARSIDTVVERFVYGRGLEPGELAEIARVRRRMERELAREDDESFNLKMGRGGLVDVEFLAQAAALAHGHRHPELRNRATRRLVDAMGGLGLISEEERAGLSASYSFLRGLENRLRIEGEHPIERIRRDPAALSATARRMGIEGPGTEAGEVLLEEYDRHRERVRGIYDRLVGRHAPDEDPA